MKKFYRRSISGLLALLICFTAILSSGVTAFAASSSGETAKSYSVAFPRDGDANLDTSGTWGHDELHYMNGWTSGENTWMTTLSWWLTGSSTICSAFRSAFTSGRFEPAAISPTGTAGKFP